MLPAALAPTVFLALLLSSAADTPPSPRWARDANGVPIDGQVLRIDPPPPPLRIAILPDRTTGRSWGLPYLDVAVEDLARLAPDAIFTIGDMVQGYTRCTDTWEREVAEWAAIVAPLGREILPTPGNHDLVSGTRDPADRTFEDLYRERFGPVRYAVELPGATVVVATSEEDRTRTGPRLSDEQLAWLDEVLAAASARHLPTFLLLHRPLWRSPSAEWDLRVHPLLVRHRVDAVIAGHFHALQRDPDRDGVQYHILGVCGGSIDQHPLTGQLHHLTLLNIPATPPAEGPRFTLHHQLVGATLGDRFVTADDQARAWRLKSTRAVATIEGSIPDGASAAGPLELTLSNPIDRPLELSWRHLDALPQPFLDDRLPLVARTPQEIFNPFTMQIGGPVISQPGSIRLAPGESQTVPLGLSIEPAPTPWLPPEIRIEAAFLDDAGRRVPITVVRRLPIQRELELARPQEGVEWSPSPLPISAWEFSVYDTLEPDPTARVGLGRDGSLRVEVVVQDDRIASPFGDARLDPSRWRNPHLDAVLLRLGPPGDRRLWLFELIAPASAPEIAVDAFTAGLESAPLEAVPAGVAGEAEAAASRLAEGAGGAPGAWRLELRLPQEAWRPHLRDGVLQLQIGVADNDDTYHTQWRWLAPEAAPLRIRVAGEVDGR